MTTSRHPSTRGASDAQIGGWLSFGLAVAAGLTYADRLIDHAERIVFLRRVNEATVAVGRSLGADGSAWCGYGIMVVVVLLWMWLFFSRARPASLVGLLTAVTIIGSAFAGTLILRAPDLARAEKAAGGLRSQLGHEKPGAHDRRPSMSLSALSTTDTEPISWQCSKTSSSVARGVVKA